MLHWSQGGQGHWHFALSVSLHRCTAGQAAAVRRPVFPPHGNGAAGKQKSWEQSRSRDRSRRARGTDNTSFSTRCGKSQFSELSSFQGPTFWDLDSQKHHSEILGLLSALDTENNSNDIPKLRRHKRKKRGKTRFSPPHQHPKAFVARVATTAESACAVARAHAQSRPGACREFQPLRMLGPARCDTDLGHAPTRHACLRRCEDAIPPEPGLSFRLGSPTVVECPLVPSTSPESHPGVTSDARLLRVRAGGRQLRSTGPPLSRCLSRENMGDAHWAAQAFLVSKKITPNRDT